MESEYFVFTFAIIVVAIAVVYLIYYAIKTVIKDQQQRLNKPSGHQGQIIAKGKHDIVQKSVSFPRTNLDIMKMIGDLGDLKNKGNITEDEFEAKKKELLSRIK